MISGGFTQPLTLIGSNEINISCIVQEEDALKAMTILHTRLFLYSEEE